MIRSDPNNNFVGVFADEAISGTTDKRPNFQRMIKLAEQGYIDVIYTKSISRFSRNVADLLKYCEILRNHGVNLIFEENGLKLLDSTGSLLLTILGAIAQMEVENTSDHISWTLQKKMESGELVGQPNPLGYDIIDNQLVVNEEEAEIVRYIFKRYLEGAGSTKIAKELQTMGVKTKRGNSNWCGTTVMGIIKNEKYTGLLIQGKTYTVNPIGHKREDNHGRARKYKTEDHHEAIISLETWERAQEIAEGRCVSYVDGRKRGTTQNSNLTTFTSKLVCAYCGKHYVRRKVHAGTKYEKVIWNCTTKCKQGKDSCPQSKPLEEEYLKQAIVLQIKNLLDDSDSMFYLSNGQLNTLLKQSEKKMDVIEEQIIKCQKNIQTMKKKKAKLLDLFLEDTITEEQYNTRSANIDKDIVSTTQMMEELSSTIKYEGKKNNTAIQIARLISDGKLEGFNEELFNYIIDRIVVGGRRSDGVDDPKSLHFELNAYNLDTDMITKVDENGVLRYTTDRDMSQIIDDCADDMDSDLCSIIQNETC